MEEGMRPSIIESGQWDAVEPFIIYVHSNIDSYRMVELQDDGTERFSREVHQGLHYLGYEIGLLYMVDMVTGKSELVGAQEGEAWLTLNGEQPSEETVRRGMENGAT
jgi:hypothetical protein